MKKILCLLALMLILTGCQSEIQPAASTETETSLPTLLEQGTSWDEAGVLTELPLSVPQGWHCTQTLGLDGDLLIWGMDDHRSGDVRFQLYRMDPITGQVISQRELSAMNSTTPRILGDQICFCDSISGQILVLDRELQVSGQWTAEPDGGFWVMGADNTLYQYQGSQLTARDLTTGEVTSVPENAGDVYSVEERNGKLLLCYSSPDAGGVTFASLDLTTGQMEELPFSGNFDDAVHAGDAWLCRLNSDYQTFYLGNGEQVLRVTAQDGNLSLLPEGYLLETAYDSRTLTLYRTDGSFVSRCELSQTGSYYPVGSTIWNQELGGYLLHAQNPSGDNRLLFWDIQKGTEGTDLEADVVPPLSEALSQLREEADALEAKYGVTIWIGEKCQTVFYDFSGEWITDWDEIHSELQIMELALSSYPEGFFRQITKSYTQGIQIHLLQNLQATVGERVGGSYCAFTQNMGNSFLIACDILQTEENTYYHEFSHVIDSFLESQSWIQGDSLYSEEGWMVLNPDGFEYSYNYAANTDWFDNTYHGNWFIDTYATISPTEDRARVMEYGMMSSAAWWFEGKTGLLNKLDYYARCIREAFDTTGWPETTRWEQYLYLRNF